MNDMERKIGEIFEYNGEWYQCVEGRCKDCHFSEKRYLCKQFIVKNFCLSGIIFKKLEKVGESYMNNEKIVQKYKIYHDPLIAKDGVVERYVPGLIDIVIKQTKEDMEEKNNGNTPLNVLTDKYVKGDICYDDFEKEVKALYSCKEEIKPTLKEFDLEAAKLGKPVCTRDGRKARIICFDRRLFYKNVSYPILALVECSDGEDDVCGYNEKGKVLIEDGAEYKDDLMMLPEKKEGWVNVYKRENEYVCENECNVSTGIAVYKSEGEAKRNIDKNEIYVNTIKISWEE